MRKVRPVHHLSWFATDSWCAKTRSSTTRELNRHGRCCGFLDCLEAKLWTRRHSGVNHGAACARAACLPASTWRHASRDTSSQPCLLLLPKGELFQDRGRDLCFLVHLSVDAVCVWWGQAGGRIEQLSLSQKAFLVGEKTA